MKGTALAVKPWSSFQCTGIHHAVRAPTYKGDEHLASAPNKSMAPSPIVYLIFVIKNVSQENCATLNKSKI